MSQPRVPYRLDVTTPLLSPEQKQIISENPMSSMLDTFRASLPKNFDNFHDYIASAPTNDDAEELFNQLVSQLAVNPSAKSLFLLNSNDNFKKKLYEFLAVWSQQKRLPDKLIYHCSSLLEKAASNASDLDIW